MKRSKRYLEAEKLVDKEKVYSIEEAIDILKSLPKVKFDETLELSCKLEVDPKKSEEVVRGSLVLPHGTGKQLKILVFCEPDKEADAQKAGADYIGSQELADKILKEGWLAFDYCISTPSMMKVVSKLGKILGPRGLMPSPKTGTVTDNISYAVGEAKRGKLDFRMDKFGCIHVGVGKISFTKPALVDNTRAFMDSLFASRPSAVKGDFVRAVYLSTTMSPSLRMAV